MHENAQPHTIRLTTALLDSLGRDIFWLPAYSPDLVSSELYLFALQKTYLTENEFSDVEEEEEAVNKCIKEVKGQTCREGIIKNVIARLKKCLDL